MSVHSPACAGIVSKIIYANKSSHSWYPLWWPGMCLQTCSVRRICRAGETTGAESDDRTWLSEGRRKERKMNRLQCLTLFESALCNPSSSTCIASFPAWEVNNNTMFAELACAPMICTPDQFLGYSNMVQFWVRLERVVFGTVHYYNFHTRH